MSPYKKFSLSLCLESCGWKTGIISDKFNVLKWKKYYAISVEKVLSFALIVFGKVRSSRSNFIWSLIDIVWV